MQVKKKLKFNKSFKASLTLAFILLSISGVRAVTLVAGTQIQPNASGGATGYYVMYSDYDLDSITVGEYAELQKSSSVMTVTNINTSSVFGIGNNVTLPPVSDVYMINITDYYSGQSWGIKVYFNGTNGHPNMTSGIKYVDYTYEDSSYLQSPDQRNIAGSVFLMVIVGTMAFAYFSITGGIETGMIAGIISLLVVVVAIIPIMSSLTSASRDPTEVIGEQIDFQYNDTYYATAHSPIHSIMGIYNDSSSSGKFESSQYSYINSGG